MPRPRPPAYGVYGTGGGVVYEIAATSAETVVVPFGEAPAPGRRAWRRGADVAMAQRSPLDTFDFFQAIHDGRQASVTFDDAVRVQAVLDAAERSAASSSVWVDPTDPGLVSVLDRGPTVVSS